MTQPPTTTDAVPDSRPVTIVRYRPGVAGETARTVHLVPLPVSGPAGTALCGTLLRREDVEHVMAVGQGIPYMLCVLRRVAAGPPPAPVTTGGTREDTDPGATMAGYRARGWPVIQCHDQIRLTRDGTLVALIIPVPLARPFQDHLIGVVRARTDPPHQDRRK